MNSKRQQKYYVCDKLIKNIDYKSCNWYKKTIM